MYKQLPMIIDNPVGTMITKWLQFIVKGYTGIYFPEYFIKILIREGKFN